MPRPHLLGLLEDAARWGEQTAFSRRRGLRLERWSWGRVRRVASQAARELETRGVSRGERVLLQARAGPEWVAVFWGCLLRGAVVVPLDVDSPPDLVEEAARQVEPRLRIDEPLLEENGGNDGDIIQMAGDLPGVVCDEDIARHQV